MNERSSHVHPKQAEPQSTKARQEWMAARQETSAASQQAAGLPTLTKAVYMPRRERYRKRWYNQGWTWLLVAFVALTMLMLGFIELSEQAGLMTEAIQDQADAAREQTGALRSLEAGLDRIQVSVSAGFERLAKLAEDIINALLRA